MSAYVDLTKKIGEGSFHIVYEVTLTSDKLYGTNLWQLSREATDYIEKHNKIQQWVVRLLKTTTTVDYPIQNYLRHYKEQKRNDDDMSAVLQTSPYFTTEDGKVFMLAPKCQPIIIQQWFERDKEERDQLTSQFLHKILNVGEELNLYNADHKINNTAVFNNELVDLDYDFFMVDNQFEIQAQTLHGLELLAVQFYTDKLTTVTKKNQFRQAVFKYSSVFSILATCLALTIKLPESFWPPVGYGLTLPGAFFARLDFLGRICTNTATNDIPMSRNVAYFAALGVAQGALALNMKTKISKSVIGFGSAMNLSASALAVYRRKVVQKMIFNFREELKTYPKTLKEANRALGMLNSMFAEGTPLHDFVTYEKTLKQKFSLAHYYLPRFAGAFIDLCESKNYLRRR